QFAGRAELPTLPNGLPGGVRTGPDPRLYIPLNTLSGARGDTVQVPIRMNVAEPGGLTYQSFDVNIAFDPNVFSVPTSSNTQAGPLTSGFFAHAIPDNTAGTVRLGLAGVAQTVANGTDGIIAFLTLQVKPTASLGTTPLNLIPGAGIPTQVNGEPASVNPYPTNAANDANVDGNFTVADQAAQIFLPTARTAVFTGKANIQDITDPANPVSVDGNATLQVTM